MAQRHEPDDSLDDFPTMPWGTRALCNLLEANYGCLDKLSAWEPACNRGYMSRPLAEYFHTVHASDIFDYEIDAWIADFLYPTSFPNGRFDAPDWIITNPPFRLAEQFIQRACEISARGVAMLTRTSFLESSGRYNNLFKPNPPSIVAQFVERLPMVKGRMDRKASTATSYCWLIWADGHDSTQFQWIPPCRAKLERDSDYEVAA
jgi:hypothetical protein